MNSIPYISIAQTSGTGCRIGNNIYTEYLGYAKHPSDRSKWMYYFKSNGKNYPINYNNSERYKCGWVNSYSASSYWDSSVPPYGAEKPIPAQNEFSTVSSGNCAISNTLGGSLSGDGGDVVRYSVNNPTYCSSPPTTNVPLDDNLWIVLFAIIGSGAFYLSSDKTKRAKSSSI